MKIECNKMILDKVCKWIVRPLEEDPVILFLFLILFSSVNIIESSCGNVKYGIYIFAFAFCQCYLFYLFITLSKTVYRVVKPILTLLLFFYFTVALFCYTKFKFSLSPDIFSLLLATNLQEAKEMISVYFGYADVLLFIGIAVITFISYRLSFKIKIHLSTLVRRCFMFLMLVLSLGIIRYYTVATKYWNSFWLVELDELTDLSLHYTHPNVEFEEGELPDRVVVIIGESFAKSHSSLYGYQIETNPGLGALKKDSSLYVFSQVQSPAVSTIPSFKQILNTHLVSDSDSIKWYETTTLIELLRTMGYTTHWMSNQAKAGMYDNVASAYAKICDTFQFVHDAGKDHNYDEKLLELEPPHGQRQAVFYHLMGQHVAFWCRYPSSFNFFTDSLYSSCPDYEIEPRRAYDNATLYNDYVCSEIISKYKNDDAMVFYFSDHGLDFFDVDGYHGHGRMEVPESVAAAEKIPFFVYLSNSCRERHPNLVTRVKEKMDQPLCTDAFTQLVMLLLNAQVYGE